MSQLQKLIDITFQMVLVSTDDPVFCKKSTEEKAEWVAETLRNCGFDTQPLGSSWGVLKKKTFNNLVENTLSEDALKRAKQKTKELLQELNNID